MRTRRLLTPPALAAALLFAAGSTALAEGPPRGAYVLPDIAAPPAFAPQLTVPAVPVYPPYAYGVPTTPPVVPPPLVYEAPVGPGWGGWSVFSTRDGYLGCVDRGFIGQPGVAPPPYPYSGYSR